MLSYQHAYHAGNFADVLKHTVLCLVLDYMKQKDKPFYFHDTHAGRGLYPLSMPEMQKLREHEQGILRLWPLFTDSKSIDNKKLPPELASYAQALLAYNNAAGNDAHPLTQYPGSGLLAHRLMRGDDQLILTELHPAEFASLETNTEYLHNVHIQKADAWAALKAALPPRQKRGVILIDPSYELKNEHQAVIDGVADALKRFATGVYLVWYPIISGDNINSRLTRGIRNLAPASLLQVELKIAAPSATEDNGKSGLIGSGMLVINAPWQLDSALHKVLPVLVPLLAYDTSPQHVGADYDVRWLIKS